MPMVGIEGSGTVWAISGSVGAISGVTIGSDVTGLGDTDLGVKTG